MEDPIVNEVRKYRKEILESHGSITSYHNAVMERQKQYGDRLVEDSSKLNKQVIDKKNSAER